MCSDKYKKVVLADTHWGHLKLCRRKRMGTWHLSVFQDETVSSQCLSPKLEGIVLSVRGNW